MDLYEWERIDDLQYKNLKLIQDKRGFCFGVDAVLLANFAVENIKKDNHVLDLCTGSGIVPILLSGKTQANKIFGIEIQTSIANMAKRSVILNKIEETVEIIEGDLKNSLEIFKLSSFDIITCNPPYMNSIGGIKNKEDMKTISRHEIKCNLEDVISVSSKLLKTGGKFHMVHRPDRLVDIIYLMRQYKLEPKRIRFIHPSPNKKANILLIEGARNGKAQLKMMEPLYVYNSDGNYSDEINKIYEREK